MPATLPQRRRAEIQARVQSLESEWNHWRQRTGDGALARHRSQVRRVADCLEGLLDPLRAEMAAVPDAEVLRKGRRWETAVLAAHALWEFFRSKLVLRESPHFRLQLAACDDLAWACYQPARDAFGSVPHREPPLVYLNALWSPFAMARGGTFADEIHPAPGLGRDLSSAQFQEALDRLPIPLVGLPWYHTAHLPAALLIAHEVGHVVAWDFDLGQPLADTLRSALAPSPLRLDSWLQWRDEVFADLFATCAIGPAYLGSLIDLLAASPEEIRSETGTDASHPPRGLRVLLVARFAELLGFTADAARLVAEWESACGRLEQSAAEPFGKDLPLLAPALVSVEFRQRKLVEVLRPSAASPRKLAESLRLNLPLIKPLDARALFAAARWVHENRSADELADVSSAILRELDDPSIDAVRNAGREAPTGAGGTSASFPSGAPVSDLDREAGRALYHDLFAVDGG